MKLDMKQWLQGFFGHHEKRPMPVLSFPAVQLMGCSVQDLISDSELQAQAILRVSQRVDEAAAMSPMDLSVEAECFGSTIIFSDTEVPTVRGSVVASLEDAKALRVPEVGEGRTGIYTEAVRRAAELVTDRPVLAGVIGPFSLTGRLMDVTEVMVACYDDPDTVNLILEKTSDFIIKYCLAFKEAGANGVVMAEPLAGMLSPALSEEFSCPFVKKIVDAVQDDNFLVVYHNCGNNTVKMIDAILSVGAGAYHFGNAIDMAEMMKHIPQNVLAFGNVDPAGEIKNGTPESVRAATLAVMEACCGYPNYVLSSGCDIPPMSKWENIDAFFAASREFYAR